jgi:predicted AAA+ superfamily ATPase
MVQRKEYLETLIRFRDKKLIKVITGIRRCGKYTLLEMFQEYLRSDGIRDEQIISINLEEGEYYEIEN